MNRRTFIASAVAVAAAGLVPATQRPRVMQHVYENGDGERIAANTLEEAARYHDCYLGGAPTFDPDDWTQLDDDEPVTVGMDDRQDAAEECAYDRDGHSGPGWYVYHPDCPEEGSRHYDEKPEPPVTKAAREWAAEHDEPGYVSSTYA